MPKPKKGEQKERKHIRKNSRMEDLIRKKIKFLLYLEEFLIENMNLFFKKQVNMFEKCKYLDEGSSVAVNV